VALLPGISTTRLALVSFVASEGLNLFISLFGAHEARLAGCCSFAASLRLVDSVSMVLVGTPLLLEPFVPLVVGGCSMLLRINGILQRLPILTNFFATQM